MKTFATQPRRETLALRPCPLCSSESFAPLWDLGAFRFVRCRGCGLVQQNPQPVREDVLARYDARYLDYEVARQFDYEALERLALDDLGFRDIEAAILAKVALEGRKARILDVGCATGALLAGFKRGGWDCTGIEPCAPAARYGQEQFGLDLRATILEEAGLEPGSYDVVHASHLIEHLNDPGTFLAEALRLLAADGYLVITTPNCDGFQARLLGSAWRSAIYDHLYLFSRSTLKRLLEAAGARVLRLVTWGGWAAGLRPRFVKPPLDRLAKLSGQGDVMALLCVKGSAR